MSRTLRVVLCALSLCANAEGFLSTSSSFAGRPSAVGATAAAAAGSRAQIAAGNKRRQRVAAADAVSVVARGASPSAAVSAGGLCMSEGSAKTIVVLGGDGFCGWPTCLHLSDAG